MKIWTEKYRPKEFSDIKGQADIIPRIQAFVETENMPHLLFTGPAGVGKTSLALVISKKLFGESWKDNVLELNASDERGIDVVRDKVKEFARTRAIGNVPFKIIYLDECDALTKEAQQALRRTMENYAQTCRFILSANYSSKIIDPIQSRCAVFRFKPLPKESIYNIIDRVMEGEKLNVDEKAKNALYEVTNGDCRRLQNILQSCAALGEHITEEIVYSMASVAKPKDIKIFLDKAVEGNFEPARDLMIDTMLRYGLSGLDIIRQIQKEIWNLDIENKKKVFLIEKCGEIEFRMVEGSDPFIQLEALLASVSTVRS